MGKERQCQGLSGMGAGQTQVFCDGGREIPQMQILRRGRHCIKPDSSFIQVPSAGRELGKVLQRCWAGAQDAEWEVKAFYKHTASVDPLTLTDSGHEKQRQH